MARKADTSPQAPRTLLQAVRYFADPARALWFMAETRWPDGVVCPTCGSREVAFLASRRLWKCKTKHPRQQFSIKVGTIMEDSPIGLDKWLPCMWLVANCKNGISSYEVGRALDVTQKTAWFMLGRIRKAMQKAEDGGKLGVGGGTVQVDETWIGGKARNMKRGRRRAAATKHSGKPGPHAYSGKAIVLGMLEKGGRVRLRHVPDQKRDTLLPHVVANVARGARVHTDEHYAYDGLTPPVYVHKVVKHAETYVDGQVHTNGIENFWSLLKRTIRGTYVSVEPFHLHRYLDEQAFRFNRRKGTDQGRFVAALRAIVGQRLTYADLTGAGLAPSTT